MGGGIGPHSRQRGTGREGKAEDLGVRGGVGVACFGALSFNGDVIRNFFPSSFETEQRVGLEAAIKREGSSAPSEFEKKKPVWESC